MVIPAAGQARRFGSGENKIWAPLAGRAVVEWALSAFQAHPDVATMVLVASAGELERARAVARSYSKVTAVVPGGETRAASVRGGLEALPADIEIVLAHDAARPLVTPEVITRVIDATAQFGAAVPGLPLADTVKRVDARGIVRATVPRNDSVQGIALTGLTAVQTPQGALRTHLHAAYATYDFARAEPTDEAAMLEATGVQVAVVPGDPANIKITRPEDLQWAHRLLAGRAAGEHIMEYRTGFGYDVHAFAPPEAERPLYLGGVRIPHDRGLDGHSDADVLLHAICDALLGAASLGDIGVLFPNTDPAYHDVSSRILLTAVGQRVQEAGWQIVNIDATVLAEVPRLMPYRPEILQAIGACLGLPPERISVKATTSERMGFVGRREGIACWAVATICAPICV